MKTVTGLRSRRYSYDLCHDRHFYFLKTSVEDGKYSKVPSFNYHGELCKPLKDLDGLRNHFFFLPQRPEPVQDEKELDRTIYGFIKQHCDYPKEYMIIDVGYVKLTWISDFINTIGYRRALGSYGTGKSTWLECMLALSRLGYKQGATATPAGIYRKANVYRGTQGLDENEYQSHSHIQRAIELVLNSGYSKKTGVVTRMDKGEPVTFKTYGPKLVAARTRFNDASTESRFITHISRRSCKALRELDQDFYREATEIRNKLLGWRLKQLSDIPSANTKFKKEALKRNVEPRLIEIYTPVTRTIPSGAIKILGKAMLRNDRRLKSFVFLDPRHTVLQAVSDLMRRHEPLTMGVIAQRINEEIKLDTYNWSSKRVSKILRDMGFIVDRKWNSSRGTNAFTLIFSKDTPQLLSEYGAEYRIKFPSFFKK